MDKIEREVIHVCLFADEYNFAKSELDNKRLEIGELEEDVKELKKKVKWLEGKVRFQMRVREEDRKNSGTKREGFMRPQLWDVACQATTVRVDKGVGAVAPVVDRKVRDVAVQAAVPFFGSTSGVQTDGQVVAEDTAKTPYTSAATQATFVPTEPRNETSGGPVPPAGGAGPQPVGARALVMHGVSARMFVDEIFWHTDRLRVGVSE